MSNIPALVDARLYQQIIDADTVKILLDELHDRRLIGREVSIFKVHLRLSQRSVTLPGVAGHRLGPGTVARALRHAAADAVWGMGLGV